MDKSLLNKLNSIEVSLAEVEKQLSEIDNQKINQLMLKWLKNIVI